LVGLPVARIRLLAFVASAVMAGLAGVLLAGELGGLAPSVGPTFLLPAYAAAFLGATTIKPGRFNAVGTLVALYLLVVGVTGLELLGVESWVEQVFNGVALAVAVAFARLVSSEQAS
jgi:ribose transport system permease protein